MHCLFSICPRGLFDISQSALKLRPVLSCTAGLHFRGATYPSLISIADTLHMKSPTCRRDRTCYFTLKATVTPPWMTNVQAPFKSYHNDMKLNTQCYQYAANLKNTGSLSQAFMLLISNIAYPTPAGILASLRGWKVVVVADKKTPKDWPQQTVEIISVDQQQGLNYSISRLVHWNSYW